MGTYVIGDLHGCYQQWINFKDHIEEIDIDAKFILIGDILDRGLLFGDFSAGVG